MTGENFEVNALSWSGEVVDPDPVLIPGKLGRRQKCPLDGMQGAIWSPWSSYGPVFGRWDENWRTGERLELVV